MAEYLSKLPSNITEYPNSFERQGAFPLERHSVFANKADAIEYAKNSKIAYVGQPIAVTDAVNKIVDFYLIVNNPNFEDGLFKISSTELNADAINARLEAIEKFFAKLDSESFDKALDTLLEAQDRMNLIYDDKDEDGNNKEPSGLLVDEIKRAIAAEDDLNKRIDDLDYTYDDKDETDYKKYFVKTVKQEDGLISLTRELVPEIKVTESTETAKVLANGDTFTVVTQVTKVADGEGEDNSHTINEATKTFTLPEIKVATNKNLSLDATTTNGVITITHTGAEATSSTVSNTVQTAATTATQLKDTDSIKLAKTEYDANGHKSGSSTTEYKMPKLTAWTWASTATQVTATLGGNGITTLSIPNMPFASTTQSGVVSATTQSFAGNKTFTGTVTINKDVIVDTNANIKGTATVNDLKVTTASVGTSNVGTANVATLNATTATINQLTATNATLTNGSINALSATSATINAATIATLGVTATANINNLAATNATISTLTATTINASTANATTVSASTLTASTASMAIVTVTNATIGSLKVTGESSFENNVSIAGNLSVKGTTTSVDFETAVAKENIIVTNSENTELAANIGGIAMMTGKTATDGKAIAYGVMYDSTDDLIKLGQGRVANDNGDYEFTFDEGEKETIATREYVDDQVSALNTAFGTYMNALHELIGGDAE